MSKCWLTSAMREIITNAQEFVASEKVTQYKEFLVASLEVLSDILATLEQNRQTYLINAFLPIPKRPMEAVLVTRAKMIEASLYMPKCRDYIELLLLVNDIVSSCGTGKELLFFRKFCEFTRLLNASISIIKDWLGEDESQISDFSTVKEDLRLIWIDNVIQHALEHPYGCLVLWVTDRLVDQELVQNEGDQAVVIGIVPDDFAGLLQNNLQSVAQGKFKGRLRVALDTSATKTVVNTFKTGPLGHLLVPILVNKERVAEDEVYALVMRKGLTLSAGVNGFANFCRMSNLLWIGPVDPLMQSLAKNGVVVTHALGHAQAMAFFEDHPYVTYSKNFRVMIDEVTNRSTLVKTISGLRQHPLHPCLAPIFLVVNDYPDYDLIEEPGKMLKFPYVKEFVRTGPSFEKEYVSFGYMAPLNWWRHSAISGREVTMAYFVDQLTKDEKASSNVFYNHREQAGRSPTSPRNTGHGTLTLHALRSYNLSALDSAKSDPYCVLHINNEEVKKTGTLKKTTFPDWGQLVEWKFDVSVHDVLRLEVFNDSKNESDGMVELPVHHLVALLTGEREERVFYLRPNPKEKRKPGTKVRGTLHIDFTFTLKKSLAKPQHFGRTLTDSLRQAEADGTLHPFYHCLGALYTQVHTEGLFRLPGNKLVFQDYRDSMDFGKPISLKDADPHDVASLCKLYFAQLPAPLLPPDGGQAISAEFKRTGQIEDIEEKILAVQDMIYAQPEETANVLVDLISFLHRVSLQSELNKMNPTNLSVCWTPTIILPKDDSMLQSSLADTPKALQHLAWIIEYAGEIFPDYPLCHAIQLDRTHFDLDRYKPSFLRLTPTEVITRFEATISHDADSSSVDSKPDETDTDGHEFSLPQNVRSFVVETVGLRNERRESAKRKGGGIQSRPRTPNANSQPRVDQVGLAEAIDAAKLEKAQSVQDEKRVVYHAMGEKEDLESSAPMKVEKDRKSKVFQNKLNAITQGRSVKSEEKADPLKPQKSGRTGLVNSTPHMASTISHATPSVSAQQSTHESKPEPVRSTNAFSPRERDRERELRRTEAFSSPTAIVPDMQPAPLSATQARGQIQEILARLGPEELAQVKTWLRSEVLIVPSEDFAKYS